MDQKTLHAFENKCTQEEAPACQTMCPLHLEARTFTTQMAEGKLREARRTLDRAMPLSGLSAYLCDGPCVNFCRRSALDDGINIPMLERACADNSTSQKPFTLPDTAKKIVIYGSDLSSLSVAAELAKKGHGVKVYYLGKSPGGSLKNLDPKILPEKALPDALNLLKTLRVNFEALAELSLDKCLKTLEDTQENIDSIYLGFDDPNINQADFLGEIKEKDFFLNETTLETPYPNFFAACPKGQASHESYILSAAAGKRAAGSIVRIMQGAAPSSLREKELTYESRLYTSLEGIEKELTITPMDPLSPSLEESQAEAKRCIDCQCLECVKVCPYLKNYKSYPKKLAREMFNNFGLLQGNRQSIIINSCAECGLCEAICPTGANLGDFCAIMRAKLVDKNYMAPSAFEFALEDMDYSSKLSFFRHEPGTDKSAYIFFPGCQLPGTLPEESEKLYNFLREKLSGGVGLWFDCCGVPASWAGEKEKAKARCEGLKQTWEKAGKPKLILACASCALYFKEFLPEIPTISLWEMLDKEEMAPGHINIQKTLALHDPCSARSHERMLKATRSLTEKIGQNIEVLRLSKGLTRCCGYGGLCFNSNQDLAREFALERGEDTDNPLLVYCAMCLVMLRQTGKEAVHVLSLLFPNKEIKNKKNIADKLISKEIAGFSDRQENRGRFRDKLLVEYWKETHKGVSSEMDISLIIAPPVAEKLEKRHILRSDLRAVLDRDYTKAFYNEETGHTLACYRPRKVSFWVEYSQDKDGNFLIHDAYCHRMVVPGVPEAEEAGGEAESSSSKNSCC